MDIKKISEDDEMALYKAAEEYQTSGIIKRTCPRCGGKLQYIGNMSSYRIYCEKQCGIVFDLRGI